MTYDVSLEWGADLSVDAGGDLLLVTGTLQGNQRVLRRLLTNPGDYLWSLGYGGGLALSIGQPLDTATIEAVIRQQLHQETLVSSSPSPVINVRAINSGNGSFRADLIYTEATSGESSKLSIAQGE
jgi:hypothetical protein